MMMMPEFRELPPGSKTYLQRRRIPADHAWAPHVQAWEPVYLKGYGNACQLYMDDGTCQGFGLTAPQVYQRLARHYAVDVDSIRHYYEQSQGKSQSLPLVVTARGLVYFSVRTRIKLGSRNDGTVGYIANGCLKGLEELGPHQQRVWLTSGRYMDVQMSRDFFCSQLQRAEMFDVQLRSWGVLGDAQTMNGFQAFPGTSRLIRPSCANPT